MAQIYESIGFESFNESTLDALADIAVQYLRDLGKSASFHANLTARTEACVFDIIQGPGDFGASEDSDCLTDSGTVSGIIEYVELAEEILFAQPLPNLPVIRKQIATPSFALMRETPVFEHVPCWLPAFPDPHTYIHSPMWNERATDPCLDKIDK